MSMSIISKIRPRRLAMEAMVLAVVGAGIVTAASAHGGDASKVHGCYLTTPYPGNDPPLGSVRIVKATETCKPNETAQDWNAQGVKGDTGPQGAQGAQGPAGPQGPAGSAAVRPVVRKVREVREEDTFTDTVAQCNAGEVAVGGGYYAQHASPNTDFTTGVEYSRPYPNTVGGVPTGWNVFAVNRDRDFILDVYVLCVPG